MKTISSIALVAALAFACPVVAQEVNAGAAVGAATSAAGGTTAGDTSTSGTATGGANAGASIAVTPENATLDLNADGQLSVEEQAAAGGATGTVGAGATVNADANNDGTITPEEQSAADAAMSSTAESCDEANIGSMAAVDAAAIAAATMVRVELLADCEDSVVGAAENMDALSGNAAVTAALQGSSLTATDVVAVAMDGDTLVVYAESASDTNDQTTSSTN